MKHSNRLVNMAIETCADEIEELRACDVARAISVSIQNHSFADAILFIVQKRPDLQDAVFHAMTELKENL